MRKLGRALAVFAGISFAAVIILFGWINLTAVSAADVPPLKDGDIIFQYSGSSQSLPILLASRSVYTHMGIIEVSGSGGPLVLEASSPVKATPLDEWIKRGNGRRITIKRVIGLTAEQAATVLKEARTFLGLPYDLYFLNGRDAIYCSELIHLAFDDGVGIPLGTIQKVKELDIDYAPIRKLIEQRWQKYPLCRDGQNWSFEDCYKTILEQELVTPASIARDSKLQLVFTNFGLIAE
jgi:hypothetical protein